MNSNLDFKLNKFGVRRLLHSEEMTDVLMGYAEGISSNAGTNFEAKHMGTRVIVVPKNEEGEKDNLNNNTLLKAVR